MIAPKHSLRHRYLPLVLVLALFTALTVPPILLGKNGTQQAIDMRDNHLPQVNAFVSKPLSLLNYSATAAQTPGHHIALAWIGRLAGYRSGETRDLPIRMANAAFGLLVLFVAWWIFNRTGKDGWLAAVLTLPIACSSYVLFAAIWIATDNGALLFYELAVSVCLTGESVPLIAIAIGCALVMWRQVYLPVAGLFGLSWLLRDRRLSSFPVPFLAAALPCAIMGTYFTHWHGATPPGFQDFNGVGIHLATPASALALLALFLPFYWGYLNAVVINFLRAHRLAAVVLTIITTALWLIGPTDHNVPEGRWGSIVWTLAQHIPSIGSHSPLVLCLSILGVIVLASFVVDARARGEIPFETLAFLLYMIGFSLQIEAFQRYVEAPILFTYGLASARAAKTVRFAWLGPTGLALAFGTLSMLRAYDILPRILN
jgi:hypothetical protein